VLAARNTGGTPAFDSYMAGEAVDVRVTDNDRESRYEARVAGELAAFVGYDISPDGTEIELVHTETEPGFEGQGVASRLAAAVLDEARGRGLALRPVCPFIARYIEHHPEYADLVARGGGRRA
jgi:predicted GNAT family acetyltransferase